MGKKSKSVLELTNMEAKEFFLKNESYANFDLPQYFNFSKLLKKIDNKIKGKNLSCFYNNTNNSKFMGKPRSYEKNNHILFNNKDGRFAWRPMELIHPAIYVSLINKITEKSNWKTIKKRFAKFKKDKNIICFSIPIKSLSDEKDKAEQISKWWSKIEQRSVEFAMDYEYMLRTDITDCYGSIYTHSIVWALHGKKKAKDERNDKTLIGAVIDKHIQDMRFGQTNGIPQGSTLMDFISEMVLGYADLDLLERIKKESDKSNESINDFRVIRYRDDYRIFTNNLTQGKIILKLITEAMIDLGMKLNPSKTTHGNDVIISSIKPDKLAWLEKQKKARSLQKKLLLIYTHSKKYPNSGSLIPALKAFHKKLAKKGGIKKGGIKKVMPIISIIVDIAFHNPKTYPITVAILSRLIESLDKKETKKEIFEKINKKFEKIPNTGHLQLWLQRLTLKFDDKFPYNEKLCKEVIGDESELWCSDWLKEPLKEIINKTKIVDKDKIETMNAVIDPDEIKLFRDFYG